MNASNQEDINFWIENAEKWIKRKWELFNNGFYEENDLPHQGLYLSLSSENATIGRASFLNQSPIKYVRKSFSKAVEHMLKNFKMAYDKNDSDYQGDKWPPKNPHYTGHKDSVIEAKHIQGVSQLDIA